MMENRPNWPNRFMENLGKKVSIGGIVTMSDLTVSELCGDCGMVNKAKTILHYSKSLFSTHGGWGRN